MFRLPKGHKVEYVAASGSLNFHGKGWFWERWLVALGLIRLELFTIVLRTLTFEPRLWPTSNLSWVRPQTWLPWSHHSCVQLLPEASVVNKVDQWNPGFYHWRDRIAIFINFQRYKIVVSLAGTKEELCKMARELNHIPHLVAIELNESCLNSGQPVAAAEEVIEKAMAVKKVSIHPIFLKLSVDHQDQFPLIATGVCGIVAAFSLNSVRYELAYPDRDPESSPVWRVGKPGSGAGSVSGKRAQKKNWEAVRLLAKFGHGIPVIAPSIMEFDDIEKVHRKGASAVSFGAIHLPDYPFWRRPWTLFTNPCKPTRIVKRDLAEKKALEKTLKELKKKAG